MRKIVQNKQWKISTTFLLLQLIGIFSYIYGVARYSVTKGAARIYESRDVTDSIRSLPIGFTFSVKEEAQDRCSFVYQGKEYWISRQDILPVNFTKDNFSESSILYDDFPLHNGTDLSFFYRGDLVKISFVDARNPTIISRISLTKLLQIKASSDQNKFVLLGDNNTNVFPIINIATYDRETKDFKSLAVLNIDDIAIKTLEFSPAEDYVSVLLSSARGGIVLIFDLINNMTFSFEEDIFDLQWLDDKVLFYQKQGVFLYHLYPHSGTYKKTPLYLASKPMRQSPDTCCVDGNIFLSLDNHVFKINTKGVCEQTTFQDLSDISDSFIKVEKTKFLYNNKLVSQLSGLRPKWNFISLLDHNILLCKTRDNLINSLFVYDVQHDTQRELLWVEDPKHILSNHTFIEIVIDKNQVWFMIEKPEEFVYLLQLDTFL